MGITEPLVVQELGQDDDTDDDIRADVEEAIGGGTVDGETDLAVDAVLLWWRAGDGDLVDELGYVAEYLTDEGFVWILTPGVGKPGHVALDEIAEDAEAAGLAAVATAVLGAWSGSRAVRPRALPGRR
ncbi:DUF3052 family protein [Streptomyces sp. NPDC050504]|uniref:DUF3052 family protein n=1 Tax=Streptomyces sp. NPDC050504 TaxID=3365618 RepID=UPI0037B657C8